MPLSLDHCWKIILVELKNSSGIIIEAWLNERQIEADGGSTKCVIKY